MSPELIEILNRNNIGNYDAEKCDIFSLGITFLRLIINLEE